MVFFTQMIKHTFILFLMANLLLINVFSQTNVNGKILDEETNEELIGASVKIVNSSYGCVTDFNGDFEIKTNIPLPFSIEVSYIGYDSKVIDLIDNQRLKIGLKSKDLQLKAVEVISGISKHILSTRICLPGQLLDKSFVGTLCVSCIFAHVGSICHNLAKLRLNSTSFFIFLEGFAFIWNFWDMSKFRLFAKFTRFRFRSVFV